MTERITDHVARALLLLPAQFREKARLEALLSAFIAEAQDLEDALFELLEERGLDAAVGVQLDRLGELLGEERRGLEDSAYRLRLKVRIQRNLAQGEPERMIEVLRLLTGSDVVELWEPFPAVVRITFDGQDVGSDAELKQIMDSLASAGVRVELVQQLHPAFVFSGLPPEHPDEPPGGGFASVDDPQEGGRLSRLL